MSNKATIKENINKLELLMEWFERDDTDIEAAIEKYKEAKKLADTIKKQLDDVKTSITVLEKTENDT